MAYRHFISFTILFLLILLGVYVLDGFEHAKLACTVFETLNSSSNGLTRTSPDFNKVLINLNLTKP